MVRLTFLEKKILFQSEISTYSLIIRLFYFQKYRNFIGSRSCSNQTKLGMEYQQCNLHVKQKKIGIACLGKVSFSYGNLRLFQISKFKNRSF